MSLAPRELLIPAGEHPLRGVLLDPPGADWLYLFAHGAGAGMRHRFMDGLADRLAARGIATLRYEFPYMSAGARRPDPAPRLEACVRAAASYAAAEFPDLRIAAGGKSMGGRMTSQAQASAPLDRVERIVFTGFPLHPAGRPGTARAEHLAAVTVPLLFLQGTRDALADLDLVRQACAGLPTATLHVLDGADHGFNVLRSSGRTGDDILEEMAEVVSGWLRGPVTAAP